MRRKEVVHRFALPIRKWEADLRVAEQQGKRRQWWLNYCRMPAKIDDLEVDRSPLRSRGNKEQQTGTRMEEVR